MYHSLTIGNKNTYSDWYLVPDGRLFIAPPEVKTTFVDVPGVSGSLDLSQLLTNYPLYNNREGDLSFHVLNEKPYSWIELYQEIANYLHGKRLKVVIEDDPDYYYEGILKLNAWTNNNDGTWSDITIGYILDPYKYYKNDKTYQYTVSNSSKYLDFQDNSIGQMPVVPEIKVTSVSGSGLTVVANNVELGISNLTKTITHTGTYKFYDIVLSKIASTNVSTLSISGTGTFKVSFRKGEL